MSKSINDIIEQAQKDVESVMDSLPKVRADKIGLDRRAGYVYVDVDNGQIIARRSSISSLEYYGGFEYVVSDCKVSFSDVKIYSAGDDRVADALDYYKENHCEE